MLDRFRKWLGSFGSVKTGHRYEYRDPWRERTTPVECGPLPQPDTGIVSMDAAWFAQQDGPFVEVFVYWRIARDGKPTVSICDDPMGHPHAHLVRVPIPEDVQRCIAAVKNPPLCMVLEKTGKHAGECPKPTNETSAP